MCFRNLLFAPLVSRTKSFCLDSFSLACHANLAFRRHSFLNCCLDSSEAFELEKMQLQFRESCSIFSNFVSVGGLSIRRIRVIGRRSAITKTYHSFYPLAAGGAGDFLKFSVRGGWEVFGIQGGWPFRGGSKIQKGAEDFDKFCMNAIEKLWNIQ